MKITKFRIILAAVVFLILVGLAFLLEGGGSKLTGNQKPSPSSSSGSSSSNGSEPPANAVLHTPNPSTPPQLLPPQQARDFISDYLQAREDSIGADMASSISWLAAVKPLLTPSFFAELQPKPGAPAGAQYNIAHDKNYIIKANVTRVNWNVKQGGEAYNAIYVEFTDTTINRTTGATIQDSDLPFGWTHSGPQHPVNLKVTKSGSTWLIADDTTGEDPD